MTGWTPIPGYEGRYEAHPSGKVRSVDCVLETARGPVKWKGNLLKPGLANTGYMSVCLGKNNTFNLHTIIALTFIGPRPAGQEVRHKDGCRLNCAHTNLEYGTRGDNIRDAQRHGTWHTPERYGPERKRDYRGRFCC